MRRVVVDVDETLLIKHKHGGNCTDNLFWHKVPHQQLSARIMSDAI